MTEAMARPRGRNRIIPPDRPLGPAGFILRYAAHYPVQHAVVLLSVLAAVGCAVVSQYALRDLVDVLAAAERQRIWPAFIVLALLIACDNLFWRLAGWTASRAFVAVTGDVRRDLFGHLIGHAPSYFAARLPGALAGRITAAADACYMVETTFTWRALPPCLGVLGAIAMLGALDPLMAAVLLVVAGVLAIGLMRIAAGGRTLHQAYASAASAVDGDLVDVINNMPLVRAFGAARREYDRFSGRLASEVEARWQSLAHLENLRLLHALATALLTAGLLGWAILLWRQGLATPGDVVLVVTLGFTILHGARDLAVAAVDLVQCTARLAEALETLLQPHALPETGARQSPGGPRDAPIGPPTGRISFRRVCFAYPDRPPLLDSFSLEIAPGERVGLVGRSGAGKSTVLALAQRLWDVDKGEVLLDGHPVSALTRESLAATISVVPQEVMLFHRSVLENIRYGRPEAGDAEVRAAADAAGCDEFLSAFPEGLATIVGERGVRLSGGQRQRLAIARAFLRDAPILMLDEATSSLDSESEHAVQEALDRLMRGRTVVAIAHRLSTLRNFDRIVVLEAGRIVQDGPPDALARSPGPYRQLLRRQGLRLVGAAA